MRTRSTLATTLAGLVAAVALAGCGGSTTTVELTAAPSPSPTSAPTPAPTPSPTPAPTPSPTPAPTPSPTAPSPTAAASPTIAPTASEPAFPPPDPDVPTHGEPAIAVILAVLPADADVDPATFAPFLQDRLAEHGFERWGGWGEIGCDEGAADLVAEAGDERDIGLAFTGYFEDPADAEAFRAAWDHHYPHEPVVAVGEVTTYCLD